MKVCSRCGEGKPATVEFFRRHGQKRDGLAPHCKVCASADRRARYTPRTDRRKGVVRFTNAERKRRYRERHPEKVKAEQAKRDRSYFSKRHMTRYRGDPGYAMLVRLRNRTAKALGRKKPETTIQLLGCTPDEFRAWIERQFVDGMGWHNRSEWELDHVRPLASFDLTDQAERLKACHYSNIRPLWRRENRAKGAKWA